MKFLLKCAMVFLLGYLVWTVFVCRAFTVATICLAILCLAKSWQLLTTPEDKP